MLLLTLLSQYDASYYDHDYEIINQNILGKTKENEVNNRGLFISPWNVLENWYHSWMKTVMITSFNKTALRLTTNTCEVYLNRNLPQRWIGRTRKEDDALMRWPLRSPDLTPCDFFFGGFVKDTVFVPPLPANRQIFATVSPLRWLWSTVICWHACGTRWTIA